MVRLQMDFRPSFISFNLYLLSLMDNGGNFLRSTVGVYEITLEAIDFCFWNLIFFNLNFNLEPFSQYYQPSLRPTVLMVHPTLQVTDLIDKLQKHATVCIGQLNFAYYCISLSVVRSNLMILIA